VVLYEEAPCKIYEGAFCILNRIYNLFLRRVNMNKYVVKILILLCLLYPVISYSDSWHTEIVDNNISKNIPFSNSIAIDSLDRPYIAYHDRMNNDLKYAYKDNGKWIIQTIDKDGDVGYYTSICIDSRDYPHIAYYSASNYELKYAYYDGSKWNITVVDTGGNIWDVCLVLDTNDRPHICYLDYSNKIIKYSFWDGNKWNIQQVVSGDSCSLCLDSNGNPYIVYGCKENDILYVREAIYDNNNWVFKTIESNSSCIGPSIALNSKNYPYCSYYNQWGKYVFKLAYWTGSNWEIKVVDTGYFTGSTNDIAIDRNDCVHISYGYWQWGADCDLYYAYWDGYDMKNVHIDEPGLAGEDNSIALDSKGNPHISYSYSEDFIFPIYSLKYAWYEGPYPGIDLISFTAKPNNDTITLNWSVSTDEDISGFNLYRIVATPTVSPVWEIAQSPIQPITADEDTHPRTDVDSPWTKVNTSLITGTNPYSYTDMDVFPETSYEYKLEAVVYDNNETLGTTNATSGKETPSSFEISKIYPTPADDRININVVIPSQSDIDISIYDITGRKVATVTSGLYNSGEYTLTGDVSGLTNGVYIVRMTADSGCVSKNFVVAR